MRRFFKLVIFVILSFAVFSCDLLTPLSGVKSDEIKAQDQVIIVMTYAKLGENKDLNRRFWLHTNKIRSQLKSIEGVLGYKYRRDFSSGSTYSYIIFKDEESVRSFADMPLHREAVTQNKGALVKGNIKIIMTKSDQYDISWDNIKKMLHSH